MAVHDPEGLAAARAWLAERDPSLARIDALIPPFAWRFRAGGFPGLLRLIVEQQVSTASAAAIWARVEAGLGAVTPAAVLARDAEGLRGFGLSSPKARYALAIAGAHHRGEIDLDGLAALADEPAIAALTRLTGVGRWTAEVYLMFSEGRADVFPAGDLALQEALRWADRAPARPSEKRCTRAPRPGARIAPWRATCCGTITWRCGASGCPRNWSSPDEEPRPMTALDGPRQPPASGGPARKLVIFAHGYGSNGADLIGLAPYWSQRLPQAAFVSPDAPERVPGYPQGFQWFALSGADPEATARGVRGAAATLDGFIDAELARHALAPADCALVGFSQGAMMSLHVGLRRREPLGAVVGFSGLLAAPQALAGEIRSRPPVLLVHGDSDEVIPFRRCSALSAPWPRRGRACSGASAPEPPTALARTAWRSRATSSATPSRAASPGGRPPKDDAESPARETPGALVSYVSEPIPPLRRRVMIQRRTLLTGGAALALVGAALLGRRGVAHATAQRFSVAHSDAEWRRLLSPAAYDVLRAQGTEAPGSSPLDEQFGRGVYNCAGCALPVYSSSAKFDSGTGWPSFWTPIDKAVGTTTDTSLFMRRTEVHCSRCGGHLGHVFDDGPKPTGLRYCMNGVALDFHPA